MIIGDRSVNCKSKSANRFNIEHITSLQRILFRLLEKSTLKQRFYFILSQIPLGKITTYDELAIMAGYPNHAGHGRLFIKKTTY